MGGILVKPHVLIEWLSRSLAYCPLHTYCHSFRERWDSYAWQLPHNPIFNWCSYIWVQGHPCHSTALTATINTPTPASLGRDSSWVTVPSWRRGELCTAVDACRARGIGFYTAKWRSRNNSDGVISSSHYKWVVSKFGRVEGGRTGGENGHSCSFSFLSLVK